MNAEKSFAMAMAGYHEQAFKRRVYRCDSAAKLRAVIEHESQREGDTRRERIGLCNKRLQRLK